MHTHTHILGKLLTRKRGVTNYEIMLALKTVCPGRRITDMKERGWAITSKPIEGKRHHRYFGRPPVKAS